MGLLQPRHVQSPGRNEMNELFAFSLFSLQELIWIRLPPQPPSSPVQQVTKQLQPSTVGGSCTTAQADCLATSWVTFPHCSTKTRISLDKWLKGESAGPTLPSHTAIPFHPNPSSTRPDACWWTFPCFSCGIIYPLRLIWGEWLTFSVWTLMLPFGWFLEREMLRGTGHLAGGLSDDKLSV